MKRTKADIGCGKKYNKKDYIGVDIVNYGQDHVLDISREKLPFDDDSLDEIVCHNTLEHIATEHVIFVMNEFHRVLKRNGICDIIVPRWPATASIEDPTHKSYWHERTFKHYFAGEKPRNADYGIKKWYIESDGENYTWVLTKKSIHVRLGK